MSTYFNTRIINLGPAVPDVRDNTILHVENQLSGRFIMNFLQEEYGKLLFTRWVEGGEETVGNVADPLNVEHGEPMTIAESLRNHQDLQQFLLAKIVDFGFAERPVTDQWQIRAFYLLVYDALKMQEALARVGAPVIVTVCWS